MIHAGLLVTLLAFVGGFLAIFAVNLVITDVFLREREIHRPRLEAELRQRHREMAREQARTQNFEDLAAEALRDNGDQRSTLERLQEALEQAGMKMSAANLLGIAAASVLMTGLPVSLLCYLLGGSMLWGLLAGLMAFWVPILYVLFKRGQRLEALRSQLPDSLDLMSRILRAGQTMSQAMLAIANEFRPPVATEFGLCYEQQNLGLSAEVALRDLARRSGVIELKIFVLALLVHRKTGGNLAELLDKLATIVRERYKIRGRIRALTAEGRFQAIALLMMPPIVFALLLLLNRAYAVKLLDHPGLILGSVISMAVGSLWIRSIVNFEF
jgi:tight adherence protein B